MNALDQAAQAFETQRGAWRETVQDALETSPMQHALDDANARQVADTANAEFWRRLAGSLRKALTLL